MTLDFLWMIGAVGALVVFWQKISKMDSTIRAQRDILEVVRSQLDEARNKLSSLRCGEKNREAIDKAILSRIDRLEEQYTGMNTTIYNLGQDRIGVSRQLATLQKEVASVCDNRKEKKKST